MKRRSRGFTLIELLVVSLIVAVVMLIAWSGLISLMNMTAKAEARDSRQNEVRQALAFMTEELKTAQDIQVAPNIESTLISEGFDLKELGDYGDIALYLKIEPSQDPLFCDGGRVPAQYDRVIYDIRPSTREWLGPRTLMRYGRVKHADGTFDPCESPIASDPIADALSDDGTQVPNCPIDSLAGGPGFYACQEDDRTNLTFQHSLIDTSVAEIESGVNSRLIPVQWKTLANSGCLNKDSVRPLYAGDPARLRVMNQSSKSIQIFSVKADGSRESPETIPPNETREKQTWRSSPWIVVDESAPDRCLAVYTMTSADNLVIVSSEVFESNNATVKDGSVDIDETSGQLNLDEPDSLLDTD